MVQSLEELLTTMDERRQAVVEEYRFQALRAGMVPVVVSLINSSQSSDAAKLSSLAVVNCLMRLDNNDSERTAGVYTV